jgi:uncharacterized repeat protein (TIGR01451 family)
MKYKITFLFVLALGLSYSQNVNSEKSTSFSDKQPTAVFEENKGQMKDQFWNPRPDVLYYGTSEGMNYYIKNSGMSYQLSRVESWKDEEGPMQHFQDGAQDCKQVPNQIGTYRVDAEWLDANPDFEVVRGKVLDGYNNYYNVPEGVEPALFVKKYETLTLKNVWDGIDLNYYGTNGFLETDYLVSPEADYRKIQIKFNGAELSTDDNGNLIIKTPFGEIQEGALKVYQNNEQIEAYWKISEDNVVSFEIPNYNSDLALRIDPLTRVWGTYYGGTYSDVSFGVDIDAAGNAFICGQTTSTNNIASGGHQNLLDILLDAFFVKFNTSGIRLWGTYYGGQSNDTANGIDCDAAGNVFICGFTSSTNNIASVGHQNAFAGGTGYDAFLVKFNSSGVRQWGTYYGGNSSDMARNTTVDINGNVYLAGITNSTNNIALGGHQNTLAGGTSGDAFLVKFNTSGTRLWGTYYGGSATDDAAGIASDINGNVYLAGQTFSSNNIASGGFQNTLAGTTDDAFVVKFNTSGLRLWGTYYGGDSSDYGWSIACDSIGNAFLFGKTTSTNNIASGGHQTTYGGGSEDVFLVKFNNIGSRVWGTYYGGLATDHYGEVICDQNGNVYISGYTSSSNDIASGGYQNTLGGGNDAFLVKFNSLGTRLWGTYYGGVMEDYSSSVACDASGNVFSVGYTTSPSGIALNGHQNTLGGVSDAFLVKFNQSKINGYVWLDLNANCVKEGSETVIIDGINLTIQPGNIICQTIDGIWSLDSLPIGNYTVTIDTTNLNWNATCPINQTFTVTNPNAFTDGPNFGLISTNPCSDPDVSIYAPFLRRCLPNQKVYITACNQTTATGLLSASYVDVELDPLMIVTNSSLPYTSLGNSVYRFQTGNINPGQCVDFNITVTISCNALLGQTLCMDASLFPVQSCVLDTIPTDPIDDLTNGGQLNGFPEPCLLPWDQSSLSVDGWCQDDTIYFTITNTGELGGGDMECYSPLWITVDGVVTFTDSIMIQGGQTITYSFPGDGATWILNAAQHPLHPGNSNPNAHVEACGDLSNWTPDLVNDFPQDDADPVVDIYCGVVTGSYDPNDKTGYPNGYTEQHYINSNQQLQYVIRFQNTGTDTAFTVVIRDTLDYDLNIFTITPGVASHPYEFRMYGPRVLEWTFNNILLPDSTTNLVGSNGFVTYHVEQVPDLAPGTVITNDADIYFDFNEPITTNTTTHCIFDGFVAVAQLEEMSKIDTGIKVYPNPTNGQMTIELKEPMSNVTYNLIDQQGRVVKKGVLNDTKTTIEEKLNDGMYYIQIGNKVIKVEVIR